MNKEKEYMQILKHGSKAKVITCSCGCEFSYENCDIITTDEGERILICPECGEKHTVE